MSEVGLIVDMQLDVVGLIVVGEADEVAGAELVGVLDEVAGVKLELQLDVVLLDWLADGRAHVDLNNHTVSETVP